MLLERRAQTIWLTYLSSGASYESIEVVEDSSVAAERASSESGGETIRSSFSCLRDVYTLILKLYITLCRNSSSVHPSRLSSGTLRRSRPF
jgi:hypothetical protein